MSDLADTVTDAVDQSREPPGGDPGQPGGGRFSLNTIVAVSVAVVATFVAVCNVKDGNIVQAMQQAQANGVDAWAYYQAKGTKLNIEEAALDTLRFEKELARDMTPAAMALVDRKIAEHEAKIRLYEKEKVDIKATAEGFQHEYDRLNTHDDQFDMAEATISIAIALLGITALTQKRGLLYVAWAFAGIGVVLGLAGFMGLSLHPDFLARLLS
jgi:hypothetical protein